MNEQLLQAVQRVYGDSHFLMSFLRLPQQRCFPRGMNTYLVEHESHTCTHLPRCHWHTHVYEYRGYYTVVKTTDLAMMSRGELVDRVTRAIEN